MYKNNKVKGKEREPKKVDIRLQVISLVIHLPSGSPTAESLKIIWALRESQKGIVTLSLSLSPSLSFVH